MRSRGHAVVAVLAFLVLPAASWLDGSGQLAWTMFSRTGQYRLDVVAVDALGHRHAVAPTSLARQASRGARTLLAGADRWRTHDVARVTLRRHLRDVATLACRVSGARRVELTLDERAHPEAPLSSRTSRLRCVR